MNAALPGPAAVLDFWFGPPPDAPRPVWFARDPAFDAAVRDRFGALAEAAAAGWLGPWADTAEGALALVLALDQFPRNLHRDSPAAFAADPAARAVARDAVSARGLDAALAPLRRAFLYLPFEHSEDLADQDLAVALFEALPDAPGLRGPKGMVGYAHAHREVIARFGRFPHRNAVLGRANTPEEAAYLAGPGAGF